MEKEAKMLGAISQMEFCQASVNKRQYFLISWKYLEGTIREAFLVCKLERYCHLRWMALEKGRAGCHRKMGCG